MTTPTRQTIFQMAAKKLRQDFEGLRMLPHAGVKGTEAEGLVRTFLNGHLPKRFHAGAGFIIDGLDQVSKQSDVVIYDALNCPVYRASEEAGIFPNDNVAAVVEVKSKLDKDRLREAFENIQAAKRLAKSRAPNVPHLVNTQTLGCVFAFESAITLDKLEDHYGDLLREAGTIRNQIDVIAVLDRGTIMLATKLRGQKNWAPAVLDGPGGEDGEGVHIGLTATEFGEDTLDAFLRILLMHLAFFRGIVDHPGFRWTSTAPGGGSRLSYLMSITHEQDPQRRQQKLAEYRAEVVAEFAAMSAPVPPKDA